MFLTEPKAVQLIKESGYTVPDRLNGDWISDSFSSSFSTGYNLPRKDGHETVDCSAAIAAFRYEEGYLVSEINLDYPVEQTKAAMYESALGEIAKQRAATQEESRRTEERERRIADAYQGYGDLIDVSKYWKTSQGTPLYRSDAANRKPLYYVPDPRGKEVYSRISRRFNPGLYREVDPTTVSEA